MLILLGYEFLRWIRNQDNEIKDVFFQIEVKIELIDVSFKGEMYIRRIFIFRYLLKR